MSVKYQVKKVNYTALVLDNGTHGVLIEQEGKAIIGHRLPRIGSNSFAYDAVDKYRFGCTEGLFTYKQLLTQIELATKKDDVDALMPIKGGNPITTEVVDESTDYYILKGGKAVLKANYTKGKTKPKNTEGSFGMFTYKTDHYYGSKYYFFGQHRVGTDKEAIVEAMLQAKAIIDFFEDKGDYAAVVEEKIQEVFAD